MHYKKIIALMLSLVLLLSALALPAYAADDEITEEDTYVLDRDGNGESLYLFQSPCMLGYDFNNENNGASIPIQAFIFTMYNSVTGEHFPTYCGDIKVAAKQGSDYHRLNLEDSAFSATATGMIRAILMEGFYVIPVDGESEEDFAARVAQNTADLAAASGAAGLTTGEAIAATQAAIWRVVHGPELAFPKFCRYVFKPTETKYVDLCSYNELKSKNNTDINTTIETVYNYLINLEPVEQHEQTVSPSSFVDLNDPIFTENPDGTYNATVNTTVYVELHEGDTLTLKAALGDDYVKKVDLHNGTQDITLTLENIPASMVDQEITLSIYGYQTAKGYFLFDAKGERGESQTMVGYNNSRLPVYAEVLSKDERILTLKKSTTVKVDQDSYASSPLSGIAFDLYLVATAEEYASGTVVPPENPADYEISAKRFPECIITTDKLGTASVNFLHQGLPDGVYLLKEHPHPSIVAPIDPEYLYIGVPDKNGEVLYEVVMRPKNEVKGGVRIEKDVIALGNDEASVDAYAAHTWIIGSSIPDDIATGNAYTVTDTLDNRLDYLGNLRVALETVAGETVLALAENTDYTLTVTDVDSLSEGKPSDAFEVALTVTGRNAVSNAIGSGNFSDYRLRIYFDAQINANTAMGTHIPNRADLSYINAVDFEFLASSDVPHVYTGGFALRKVDSKDAGKTLAGASFELYRPATLEEIGADDPRLTQIAGVSEKVIKISFYGSAVPQGEKLSSITTGADGLIRVSGLAYGKYYLMEIKAPDGYNPLRQAFEINVNEGSHLDENVINVTNESGAVLPSTGGIGTTLFTAGGIALLCLAALLLLLSKRRAANG